VSAYRKFIDILQSEPRIPEAPKPAKAPKANPSERVSLPTLAGLGALAAAPIKVEKAVRASKHPRAPFSAPVIWDDFRDEGASNGEHSSDVPLPDPTIIAPGKWVERIASPASSEPGFSEPWPRDADG
jgi:hypothetical protein